MDLEDDWDDILKKAAGGSGLGSGELAAACGVGVSEVQRILDGEWNEGLGRKVAGELGLDAERLVVVAEGRYPELPGLVEGLERFELPFGRFSVNAWLVWKEGKAVLFDAGTVSGPMVEFLQENGLELTDIFLTHTHPDHVDGLAELREASPRAVVRVSKRENLAGCEVFEDGARWEMAGFQIEARRTWGHSAGGTSFVVEGLEERLVIVGDALFAGSVGRPNLSYEAALETIREEIFSLPEETLVCPGHGPATRVGLEKEANPFFAKG